MPNLNLKTQWQFVKKMTLNERTGALFQSADFPSHQWKWRGNIVQAETQDEAIIQFRIQYRDDHQYWTRQGNRRLLWIVEGHRAAVFRHTVLPNKWKYKDFVFFCDDPLKLYEHLQDLLRKMELQSDDTDT